MKVDPRTAGQNTANRAEARPGVDRALDQGRGWLAGDPQALNVVDRLAAQPGFLALMGADARRLVTLVSGTNSMLGEPSRVALKELMARPSFANAPPAKQAAALRRFLSEQPFLPTVVATPPGTFAMQRAVIKVTDTGEQVEGVFSTDPGPAKKHVVEINGHSVTVFAPSQPDPKLAYHSVRSVARALAALPPAALAMVERVKIEPQRNPDDAELAKVLNDPDFESFMIVENGTVWMYPDPNPATQDRIDGGLVHETGHLLSWLLWGRSTDDPRWNRWKAAMARDHFFASDYARDSVAEDFGETYQLYQMVRGTKAEAELRAVMPARFALIDEVLGRKRPTTAPRVRP